MIGRVIGYVALGGIALVGVIYLVAVVFVGVNAEGWKEAEAAGEAFGKDLAPQTCIDEAVEHLYSNPSAKNEIASDAFLEGCLKVAALPPGYCDAVPRPEATHTWRQQTCATEGAAKRKACESLMRTVAFRCHPEAKRQR